MTSRGTTAAHDGATVFKEAHPRSLWYQALRTGHCAMAMRMLRSDPAKWLHRTGAGGYTVLNAAVENGWGVEVVEEVLGMCIKSHVAQVDKNNNITGRSNSSTTAQSRVSLKDLLDAEWRNVRKTALSLAVVLGNAKVVRCIMSAYARVEELDINEEEDIIPNENGEDEDIVNPHVDAEEKEKYVREQLRNIVTTRVMHAFSDSSACTELLNLYFSSLRKYTNESEEYVFHWMCYDIDANNQGMISEIMRRIVKEIGEVDESLVPLLFKLQNNRGHTPLHVAVRANNVHGVSKILELIPQRFAEECVNAVDAAGRTPIHVAAAQSSWEPEHSEEKRIGTLKKLLEDERTDVNALFKPLMSFYSGYNDEDVIQREKLRRKIKMTSAENEEVYVCEFEGLTALHLAILHDDADRVKLLLGCSRCTVNTPLSASLVFTSLDVKELYVPDWIPFSQPWYPTLDTLDFMPQGKYRGYLRIPVLSIAILMRNTITLQVLLEDDNIYDEGRIQSKFQPHLDLHCNMPSLHVAACCGYPEILRVILDNPKFDPMVRDVGGHTALHYAVDTFAINFNLKSIEYWADVDYVAQRRQWEKSVQGYSGKKGCVNLLLQVGIDIWSQGKIGNTPYPGAQVSAEDLTWWHEKVDTMTNNSKKSLTDASNAISITGALVATTSFVGPLQPPLGFTYESLYVHYELSAMDIFIISVSISFYLAVAAIMLSLMPSLPLRQASQRNDICWTRKIVITSVCLLISSIISELLAFGAATIAIFPSKWSYKLMSISTSIVGGVTCLLVLCFCSFILVRLIFYKSLRIRNLYDGLALARNNPSSFYRKR